MPSASRDWDYLSGMFPKVQDMTALFWDASSFNADLSNWNVSNVA
jgi:surface protein